MITFTQKEIEDLIDAALEQDIRSLESDTLPYQLLRKLARITLHAKIMEDIQKAANLQVQRMELEEKRKKAEREVPF